VINSLDEIPHFDSEDDERDFWDTHEFSDELWDSLPIAEPFGEIKMTKREPTVWVCSWSEVPDFASETEERSWWENRLPTAELLDALPERPVLPDRLSTLRGFVKIGRAQAAAPKRKVS
jgi:hypothetical protein